MNSNPKKIFIVTSGQPSANPRMVKEAVSLSEFGHHVTVIYCPISIWANEFDKELFKKNKNIDWIKVGCQKSDNLVFYFYCRIRQKFWNIFYKLFGEIFNAGIKSMVLFSQELEKKVNKYCADVYIGHNLGSLAAITKAAKKYNAKAIFDFEDFHRGEHSENSIEWKKASSVENEYVPFLSFATAASPLITKQYQMLYPSLSVTTINNCFTEKYAVSSLNNLSNQPLKLFWFSQNIGKGRGLEKVIEAMGILNNLNIELTLLGNITQNIKEYFLDVIHKNKVLHKNVFFLTPVTEHEIISIAAIHHIGLATELPNTLNRDYCLTNKIFMYLLAGNAIIFSNTKAQKFFNDENKVGIVFNQNNIQELVGCINFYANAFNLKNQKQYNLNLAKVKFNWEIESKKILELIN